MKVLLSERVFAGHSKIYMEGVSSIKGVEFYVLAPENYGIREDHFIQSNPYKNRKNVKEYFQWLTQMRKIVRGKGIDIVHILNGDDISCFCGIGLGRLGTKKIIITYHHFFAGLMKRISYRLMCGGKNRLCVVHTDSVLRAIRALNVQNVMKCEYPVFHYDSISAKERLKCKRKMGLSDEIPVIGIVGGMREDKNIIPFLKVLRRCKYDFQLLICGKALSSTQKNIVSAIEPYKDKVTLIFRRLSNEEYEEAIVASDIIYCIYGHSFDGASGPLTDGVCARKMILSCKHGSLGEITSKHCLGVTAECDDEKDVLQKIEWTINNVHNFQYNEKANWYRENLTPLVFQNTYKEIYAVCMERNTYEN